MDECNIVVRVEVPPVEVHPDKTGKMLIIMGMIYLSWSQSGFKTSQSYHHGDNGLFFLSFFIFGDLNWGKTLKVTCDLENIEVIKWISDHVMKAYGMKEILSSKRDDVFRSLWTMIGWALYFFPRSKMKSNPRWGYISFVDFVQSLHILVMKDKLLVLTSRVALLNMVTVLALAKS